MAIPLEYAEVWFQLLVAGDNEPMYFHIAYGKARAIAQTDIDGGFATWQTQWKARWDSTMTLVGGHVIEATSAGNRRWDSSIPSVVGTGAQSLLPNNCAIIAKKGTTLGGRRNRGRMFIPCPGESDVSPAGIVGTTAIGNWNTALATLMPSGAVHTGFGCFGNPVLLHQSGDASPTQISDLSCMAKIGTQRRRMRR